ncbi:hypothetical protein BX600DRAFT_474751 [Xylariales sp. PMI_506]|nr:hypothetical protein BX600DRAFT_474751 [Xylariales sp. PMI_506]
MGPWRIEHLPISHFWYVKRNCHCDKSRTQLVAALCIHQTNRRFTIEDHLYLPWV